MAERIYTIGYEGLSLEQFLAPLKAAEILTVLDVRANPISRKRGFSKAALSSALQQAGIRYAHVPAAGCPKPIREQYKIGRDWSEYTRKFLQYLESQKEVVSDVARMAALSRLSLVCFEADHNCCHRTYVASAAAELGGLGVVHLKGQIAISEVQILSAA